MYMAHSVASWLLRIFTGQGRGMDVMSGASTMGFFLTTALKWLQNEE